MLGGCRLRVRFDQAFSHLLIHMTVWIFSQFRLHESFLLHTSISLRLLAALAAFSSGEIVSSPDFNISAALCSFLSSMLRSAISLGDCVAWNQSSSQVMSHACQAFEMLNLFSPCIK